MVEEYTLNRMRISQSNKKRLEDLGLIIWETDNRCFIYKKTGVPGNCLPRLLLFPLVDVETSVTTELESDCPTILFWLSENNYEVICWNWVPGPGPGDFELGFTSEESAIEFIISYYFEKNEYFEARRLYEEEKIASEKE